MFMFRVTCLMYRLISGLWESRVLKWVSSSPSLAVSCVYYLVLLLYHYLHHCTAERKPPFFHMNQWAAMYHIAQTDPPTLQNPNQWYGCSHMVTHCRVQVVVLFVYTCLRKCSSLIMQVRSFSELCFQVSSEGPRGPTNR